MGIFSKFTQKINPSGNSPAQSPMAQNRSAMAEMALNLIDNGVLILDGANKIQFINPAGLAMLGCASTDEAINVDYLALVRLENGEGMEISDEQNPLVQAISKNEPFSSKAYVLTTLQGKKTPVEISLTFSGNSEKIIALRNITKELEEEGEQTEFISTASHEMRTPVASIEGYLGLALNPATATIDERAKQYLDKAHEASQHLGRLFRDLLDVTKLDDNRMKVHMVPVEMMSEVRKIADGHIGSMGQKNLKYSFGVQDEMGDDHMTIGQLIYAMVDMDFLREILDNLIENAVKYTPEGGSVWVGVRGDGDQVLINVTDSGMGIAPDDLTHIFQKFYRVDNSQTRTIGGTGLGLYIVKKRAEAMGGRVWAESAFGEGSTFYVSLPRISAQEYERQKMALANANVMTGGGSVPMLGQMAVAASAPAAAPVTPVTTPAAAPVMPVAAPVVAPVTPVAAPVMPVAVAPAPVATPVTAPAAVAPVASAPVATPVTPVVNPVTPVAPVTTPVAAPVVPVAAGQATDTASDMSPDKLAEMKAKFAQSVSENMTNKTT